MDVEYVYLSPGKPNTSITMAHISFHGMLV